VTHDNAPAQPESARWTVEPTAEGQWTIRGLDRRYTTKRAAVRMGRKLAADDARLDAAFEVQS